MKSTYIFVMIIVCQIHLDSAHFEKKIKSEQNMDRKATPRMHTKEPSKNKLNTPCTLNTKERNKNKAKDDRQTKTHYQCR